MEKKQIFFRSTPCILLLQDLSVLTYVKDDFRELRTIHRDKNDAIKMVSIWDRTRNPMFIKRCRGKSRGYKTQPLEHFAQIFHHSV